MTAIRAVFDGKVFVPQQPVSAPPKSEALVLLDSADPAAQQSLDQAIVEYYQSGIDAEDESWGRATAPQSHRAWED